MMGRESGPVLIHGFRLQHCSGRSRCGSSNSSVRRQRREQELRHTCRGQQQGPATTSTALLFASAAAASSGNIGWYYHHKYRGGEQQRGVEGKEEQRWRPKVKTPAAATSLQRRQRRQTTTTTGRRFGWFLRASNRDEADDYENEDDRNKLVSSTPPTPVPISVQRPPPPQQQQQQEDNNKASGAFMNWDSLVTNFGLFRQMAAPYYKESVAGRWLLAGLLVLTLMNSGVSVMFNFLSKDFWNALSAQDATKFWPVLQKYMVALAVGAPVVTLYRYQREQLAIHWREWMTVRTYSLYSQNRVYYNLKLGQNNNNANADNDTTREGHQQKNSTTASAQMIDNPDQRITQDVNAFTSYSLRLVITCLTSLIDLVAFSVILYQIYPKLFLAIAAYAVFGTAVTALLGKSLVGLNFGQLQKEADLRYNLVRIRENAESIAFYAGEDLEGQAVEDRVESVMDNRRQINLVQRNLEFFTVGYRYLVQILPVAVIAPRYFAGEIPLGVISQSVGAFNHILNDLSIIVNQFEELSSFAAGLTRLSTFFQAMRNVDGDRDPHEALLQLNATTTTTSAPITATAATNETMTKSAAGASVSSMPLEQHAATAVTAARQDHETLVNGGAEEENNEITMHHRTGLRDGSDAILALEDLQVTTPDRKRVLIRDLNLSVRAGEHLLIVGDSGAGKSSLFRCIAGLWTTGSGCIGRPVDDAVYFLPQRPYCTVGTLKDQLLYPMLDYTQESQQQQQHDNGRRDHRGQKDNGKNKIVPRSHWLKQSLTDADLLDVLDKVDLMPVAERAGDGNATAGLYRALDWTNMLSLGEQQRLAFGRLLVNQPIDLVILDEATSALDMAAEARMYNLLQRMAGKVLHKNGTMSAPGCTYVSVGHRPSLLAYHRTRLRLRGEDGYDVNELPSSGLDLQKQITNL